MVLQYAVLLISSLQGRTTINRGLELAKYIPCTLMENLLLKRSSSHLHSSPVLQQFCLLSGLPTATVVLFPGEFQVSRARPFADQTDGSGISTYRVLFLRYSTNEFIIVFLMYHF